jgi:gliding motility-associated-like protein
MSKTLFGRVQFYLLLTLLSIISSTSFALPPRAKNIYISGSVPGANPTSVAGMKVLSTLFAYFTYADPEGNPQTAVEYQWYTYDDEFGTNPQPIAGATASSFQLQPIQQTPSAKYIGVRIRVRDASGFGLWNEFQAFDSGTLPGHVLNKNKVIANGISCTKAGGGSVSPSQTLDASAPLCSPRNTSWKIEYTGIDWNNAFPARIWINWADGGGLTAYVPSLINPLVTRNDTINLTNMANQVWRVTQTHTYNYTTTGGTSAVSGNATAVCTYTVQATWGVGVAGNCASSGPSNVLTAPFTVWDRENNTALGTFDMDHDATSAGVETGQFTDICVGDRSAVRVKDVSDFNCTAGGAASETVLPNTDGRWVQFVYGTAGTTVTTGPGATEKITINGVDYTTADLPVYGKVFFQQGPTTGPLPAITDDIQMPTSGTSGQLLTVTMRSWNACNLLDRNSSGNSGPGFSPTQTAPFNIFDITHNNGGGKTQPALYSAAEFNKPLNSVVYANAAPVTVDYWIRLKTKPLPPTYSPVNYCEIAGVAPPTVPTSADFNVTFFNPNGAGVYTATVYLTNLATNLFSDNTAPYQFNPVTQGPAGNRLDVTPPPANPNVYHRYVTLTGPNGCTSDPLDAVLNIQAVKTGGTITHALGASPQAICTGTNPAAFGQVDPGGGNNVVPDDIFQWQSSPDGITYTDIGGATTATYDPPALGSTTYYRRRVREAWYDITGSCDEAFSNVYQFVVHTPVVAGSIGNPQTLCAGVTDPSAITNVTPGSGGNGTPTYSWQFSTDNFGADINTIAGATSATYDPAPLAVTTYYRRVNTSGVCIPASAFSNVIVMTVQPAITPGAITNDQIICNGQVPTGLTGAASTGGNGTPVYQWESSTTAPGTAGFANAAGVSNGQNYSPSALTQTTWYRRLTTAGVCSAQYSNTVQITVNPLPAGNVTGGGSICNPPPSPAPDMVFTFTAGTGPWDLVYSINGVNQPAVIGTSSPYTITTPGVGTYRIVSITDANGCVVTAPHANITTTGPASVVIGGAPPAFDTAPALGAAAVCSNGASTTDPSLSFNLNAASTVTAANYTLSYKVDGGSASTKTFQLDAVGAINQVNGAAATAITFNEAAFNNVGAHTLTVVSILSPTGCQTILNTVLPFTVNPLPVGVNKTLTAACSPTILNIDPFTTSVATAAGGNNVASTFTWTGSYGALTGMPASGSGNIAGTLTNATNATINAVFTVTPTSTATPACPGSTFTITVPVDPVPAIFDRTAEICSGQAFSITPINGNPAATTIVPVGTTYTWTIPAPNANITGASAQGVGVAAIGQTLTNTSNVVQTVRYVVTPKAGSCTGSTFNVDVTVDPKPVLANYTAAICSGAAFTVTPVNGAPTAATIVPAGTTYTWGAPVVTGGITGGSALANQASISQALTNPSTSQQTATYTVTATSGAQGTCVATSTFQVVVTVNPIPKLSSTLTPSGICSGNFSYNPTSLTAGATFAWSRANVPGINESASSGTGNISETLTNPTTAPVDVTYVVVTSANTCSNAPGQNVTVRVNPTPIANPVLGPANVCVGTNPFFYSVTQHAGATYSWNIPATFTVEAAGGGAVAGGGPGAFTSDYFILLKFSTPTPPAGLTVQVREKSVDGCIGLPNTLTIVAANSPPTVPIAGGSSFCKFQKGVVFSVPQNASSTFTWSVNSGATIIGPAAGTNLYQIIVDFNNSPSAQIDVTETNITGCPSNYPPLIVSLLDAPVTSPQSKTICSGDQPSSVIDLNAVTSIPSTFAWFVKTITPNVTGAFVNDTGTGPLQHLPALKNVSGSDGTIVYTVTPTASASPFCIGVPVDMTVTVRPEPVVTTVANQSFCPQVFVNGGISFPLSSNVAGAVMNWTSSNSAIGLVAGSGTGNFSFTAADNQTGVDIVSTITVSATSAGCTSAGSNIKTFTITIKPRPVVSAITDITVCPGDAVSIPAFASNTGGGETYAWTNDNTSVGLAGSGSGNIAGYFAPANNTGSDVVGNISVVATRNSCAGPARTFKITVRPQPVVTTIANQSFCPGDAISIPLTSNVAGATLNWSNNNTSTGLAASGSGNITTTAPANNTGADIVGTVTVSAVANGCTSNGANVKTFTVTIKPTPIVTAVTNITVCSGANVPATAFTSNVAAGGVTFNWTNNNTAINLGASGSGAIAAFTAATNNTGVPIVGTINVTGVKNSCSGPVMSYTITVNPEPVVTTVVNQQFCPGDAVNIPLLSNVAGATLNWSNSNTAIGLVASGTGNIAFTAPANNSGADIIGTITVSATANTCTSTGTNQKTFTITIKPTPIVNAISDVTVCSGASISTIVFGANTGGSETFSWTNDNTTVGLVASGTGNIAGYVAPLNVSGAPIVANITVSAVRNSCAGPTKTFKITVNPEPIVTAIANASFCPGDGVNIPFTSNVAGATINWANSNTAIGIGASGTGSIVYVAPVNNTGADIVGTITVTATNNGCTSAGANQKTFSITIKPTPIINAISNITVCSGGTIVVPAFGSNIGAGGVTFNWSNDNAAIGLVVSGTGNIGTFAAAPNVTSSPVVATISVSGTKNSCAGPAKTFTITVLPEPVGTSDAIAICSDAAVGVNLSTMMTGGAAASRFNITITNSAGLSASAGSPVDGTNLLATEIQNDKWTNLSGAPHDIVYHITPISGGSPACSGATFTLTVTVNPEPIVTAVTNKLFCTGDVVNIPLVSNVAGATMNWTNDNTSIGLLTTGSGNISFTAPANNTGADVVGTITVSATANGCTSIGANGKTFTIRIKPTPIVNTIADVAVCSGAPIAAITFSANTGGSETFNWTNDNISIGIPASGIGNISAFVAPANISGVPVVANIGVSAMRNGCPGPVTTFKITVNPEPVVSAVANASFCPGDGVNIPFTSNVPGAIVSWSNSNTLIGIGASGTGDIVYVAPANNTGADIIGTITVTAAKNGCTSAGANLKTFTITIKPTPIVNAISNVTVCSGGVISLPAFGSNIGSGGVTFNWTNDNAAIGLVASGTGNIAAFASAPNTTSSPRVATISVIGTKNSCSGPARTFTITVLPEPVGTPDAIAICSDAAVAVNLNSMITGGAAASRFNITITNLDGLSASAGAPADGNNLLATEIQNDKWTNTTGTPHDIVYHITPISGGAPACSGTTFDLRVTINPEPVVNAVANQSFCPGDPINVALSSNVAGATMNWSNSNPSIGLGFNGTGAIAYTAPANNTGLAITGTITITAESAGCTSSGTNTKSFDITIKPTPIVNTVTDVVVCSGGSISAINFAANTGGSETFNWTNDNTSIGLPAAGSGNISAYVAPLNLSGVPVVANITVTATRLSCSGPPMTFKITVNPEPVVTAITNQTFCAGEAISIPFTSNVAGAAITWTNTNTSIGLGASGGGNIVYVAPGNNTGSDIVGTILVTATKNGCASAGLNQKTFTITIKPTPIVNAVANITVCSGGTVVVPAFGSNVAAGGVTFNWTNDNTSVGLAASGTGNITSFAAGLNLTATPITATVSVIGTKNLCSGPARTFTITVLPQPVGNPVPVTVCSDAAVAVNLNTMISGTAATYNITITNTASLPASAGSPTNANGVFATEIQDDRWTNVTGSPQPIVYHITPIGPGSPGCVGATFDLTVTINPEPVVAAVPNQEFCPAVPANIPLTSNVAGATISWTNTNPLIGIGTSGAGDISYTTPANNTGSDIIGTITVSASSNGCLSSGTNMKSFDIKIKPTPIINPQTNIVVCSGGSIATVNFTSNTGGGETYTWTNSNTAINLAATGSGSIPGYTAPVNLTGAPITGTITVTSLRNGCSGPNMVFTITVNPEPVVAAVADQAFCAGDAINIPLTSNVGGAAISWTNSNALIGISTGGTGDIIFTAPSNNTGADMIGTITVSASKNGCTSGGANIKMFTITIKPTPIVNAMSDITVCSGQTIVVPAFGSNVVSGGVTFNWTNDNTAINLAAGGTGNITSFTAATNVSGTPMTANISVTGAKNLCGGPAISFRITINPEPVVTAVTDKEFCPGQAVNIPLLSNVPGAQISWTNSNTSIGIPGTGTGDILYTAPANNTGADFVATITVTAQKNSCISAGANSKTFQITIKATPVVASITNINVCSGDNIPAIVFTSNADPGVTFNWFNDNTSINLGASGTNTIPTFVAAVNTGSVPLIANIRVNGTKNGCTGADQTFKVTIFPEPVLGVSPPAPLCSRNVIGVILGTNGTSVSAQSYRIDNIEYSSNGGPFSVIAPAAFTVPAANADIANTGIADLIKNDVFTNLSPFTVTVRYTIVPISSSNAASPTGCPGDPAQVSVAILPEPDLDNSLNPAAICSGETIVSANAGYSLRADPSSVAATSFIIRSISAPGLVAGPSNSGTGINKTSTAINNDSWVNTSNAPIDVTYVIAPVTAGCVGLDENVVVRVNPSPAVKDGLDRIVCNDTGSGIVLQDNAPTSVGADRYDIISVTVGGSPITPGGPAVGGLSANAANSVLGVKTDINAIRNDRYVNSTNDRVIVSYTVVAISPVALNSCRGPAKVITLTVEPPIISASATTTPVICSGTAIDITFGSPTYSGAPTDPTVTFSYATLPSSISGATVGNNLSEGAKITDVLVNTTNAPITVTYRITPRASGASNGVGCTGNFQDITVRVEPKPTILPIASKTVCENTPLGLLLKSNTVPTTGSIKIFVTSTPDPEITGATNNALVANNITLGDILVNSASVTKFVTYHLEVRNVDAANATICAAAAPIDVVVGVSPTPVFSPLASFAICSGESFAPIVINTDTETATPGSTIVTWTATSQASVSGESNGAGNAFSQVLFNSTNNKQVVSYTLNATNISNTPSCAATPIPFTVTVYPSPKVVSLPTSVNVCNNGTLTPNPYPLQASTVAALGTTFDWIVDNGGNADLPAIASAANQTQINQTFVNNGSFLGTQQYTITAHLTIPGGDNPIIDGALGIDNVCTAQTDAVMVVNVAPQVGGDIYGFDLDGNTATNLYLCRGAKQFVYMDPVGLPLMTIDYEENGTPKQITKLGGLSVLQVSPAATTTYKLTKVTDKFGCSITPNKTVTVNVDEVDNAFSIVGPDISCSPFPVTFKHNQVAGTSYTWKWLDGPDSTTYQAASSVAGKLIKHTYVNPSPGSTMKFRASVDAFLDTTKYLAGCRKRPVVVEVKVYPTVAPAVFADRDVICSDDQVAFTNSTQGASSHRWFYRVSGSATELDVKTTSIVTFKIPNTSTSNPLVYEVVYQSSNGHCPAPDVVTPITVYRGVDAHFSHTTPTLFIGGHSTMTVTNDSAPVDGAAFRYDWQFGLNANPETASSVGPTFNLDYTTPGPKELTLTATNIVAEAAGLSCFDEYKETVNIAVPPLIADFIVVPLQACFPTDITVTENHATGDKFEWRVLDAAGTAAQSNADLPVFKIPAPGKYTVELTTSNTFTGDQKTATKDVIVYDLPMASFDFRPGVVYVPDTEMLTYNFSDGATSYSWDFGDGATSDEREPTHTYKIEGVYDITLIAQNDHGGGIVCVDTLSRKITAKQGGVTRVPNAFTPSPNGPSTSTGGNPSANSFNDVFLPQVKGAEEFNMQVFDRWGNLIFESNNSNVGWDGYDKHGKLLPAGVYVYKLTLRLSDGQRTTQVGDITMIR